MKSALKSWRLWLVCGTIVPCLAGVQTARADLLLTAQSVNVTAGSANNLFNIYVTNQGTAAVDVNTVMLGIDTNSPDIGFEQATTGTTLFPYVFAENSEFGPDIGSGQGQSLDTLDTAEPATVINPGASFGLALVSFDVAPGAAHQVAAVTFNTTTGLLDPATGMPLPAEFASGTITVSATPEPATGMLLLVGLAGLMGAKRHRFGRLTAGQRLAHCRVDSAALPASASAQGGG